MRSRMVCAALLAGSLVWAQESASGPLHLMAGVAAFGLMSGIAFAQAYPPAPPPPPGTLVIPAPPPPPIPWCQYASEAIDYGLAYKIVRSIEDLK